VSPDRHTDPLRRHPRDLNDAEDAIARVTGVVSPRLTDPTVASDVPKYCHLAIRFCARFCHELDAGGHHAVVPRVEVIDPEKEADTSTELCTHCAHLKLSLSTGQHDARLCARRAYHDPSLSSVHGS
jgi:hypothetical protein